MNLNRENGKRWVTQRLFDIGPVHGSELGHYSEPIKSQQKCWDFVIVFGLPVLEFKLYTSAV
jgi:hypothetical protein